MEEKVDQNPRNTFITSSTFTPIPITDAANLNNPQSTYRNADIDLIDPVLTLKINSLPKMTDTNNYNNNNNLPEQPKAAIVAEQSKTIDIAENIGSDEISIPSQNNSSVKNPSLKTADRSDHEDASTKVPTDVPVENLRKVDSFKDQNEMVNTGSGNDFKAQNLELNASALNQEEIEDKMRQRREKRRQEKEAAERERKKKELQKLNCVKMTNFIYIYFY